MSQLFTAGQGIKIAVIGGGTGSFTLLKSLKEHTNRLAAIVNMADDGGSTGVLRDELGALPPGDVRQCLVALSESPKVRDLFNYRFEEGTFKGHPFGNVMLSALEKMTGSFSDAVETAADILRIQGVVIPVTLDDVRLKMEWPANQVVLNGERIIDEHEFADDPRGATLSLQPNATVNPLAVQAIDQADLVVIAPGDLYTSLGPLLLIDGVGQALVHTKAPVVYVANLVTKRGQTQGFAVSQHAAEIERLCGHQMLDYVLYNRQQPDQALAKRYEQEEGSYVTVADDDVLARAHYRAIGGDFLGELAPASQTSEHLAVARRSLIRHDADVLANAIIKLYYAHE